MHTLEKKLAELLLADVVFLVSKWYFEGESLDVKEQAKLYVECTHWFQHGSRSDCQPLPYNEIENLYTFWKQGEPTSRGVVVWVAIQRKELPRELTAKAIRDDGTFNIDNIGLGPNRYDPTEKAFYEEALKRLDESKFEVK